MTLQTVPSARTRRTETPNATMTTLASPSLGDTEGLSLWVVEMSAGARGPRHVVDSEQLWTLVSGELIIDGEGETAALRPGDTAVLPAGAERQISAPAQARALVCGHGAAVVRVVGETSDRGTPAWIA
ncbi:MAG TPA: cupin domain-containing protein [Solirubrobacteraceae bacterium]|nr:cupin domain-containing protein [Solirubrobacteraceae bacterium]